MKHFRKLLSAILLTLCFIHFGCNQKSMEMGEMIIYSPSEISTLFDNALKVDTIGEPIVKMIRTFDDSTHDSISTTLTSQYYMIYVARDKDNHLIPKDRVEPTQIAAMLRLGGGIGVLTSCGYACKRAASVDLCPGLSGCVPTGCGCTPPNCGGSCTLSQDCTGTFSGFGFGSRVIL